MTRYIAVLGFVLVCARPASADILTITSVHVDSGTVVVGYGGLAEVLYDSLALNASPCVGSPYALGCDAIAFAGGSWGSTYTFVRPLLAPITACTYEVIGTFTLDGLVYTTTAPLAFTFTFDDPTMRFAAADLRADPAVAAGGDDAVAVDVHRPGD